MKREGGVDANVAAGLVVPPVFVHVGIVPEHDGVLIGESGVGLRCAGEVHGDIVRTRQGVRGHGGNRFPWIAGVVGVGRPATLASVPDAQTAAFGAERDLLIWAEADGRDPVADQPGAGGGVGRPGSSPIEAAQPTAAAGVEGGTATGQCPDPDRARGFRGQGADPVIHQAVVLGIRCHGATAIKHGHPVLCGAEPDPPILPDSDGQDVVRGQFTIPLGVGNPTASVAEAHPAAKGSEPDTPLPVSGHRHDLVRGQA